MSSLFLSLAFLSLIVAPALLALLTPSSSEDRELRREAAAMMDCLPQKWN